MFLCVNVLMWIATLSHSKLFFNGINNEKRQFKNCLFSIIAVLFTDFEFLDNFSVSLNIFGFQVIQQAGAFTY